MLLAERERGGVHHAEAAVHRVGVGEVVELLGGRVLLRVGGVDSVDLRRLDEDVRPDFAGAERGAGVGRKEGVAGAGGEEHDAPLLEVAQRAAVDEGLGDALAGERGHHARREAGLLDRVLEGEGVDDRREHAHVVAGAAVDAERLARRAAEDVAAAEHDRDVRAHVLDGLHLGGHPRDDLRVDALPGRAVEEDLAAELEQDALVFGWHGTVGTALRNLRGRRAY